MQVSQRHGLDWRRSYDAAISLANETAASTVHQHRTRCASIRPPWFPISYKPRSAACSSVRNQVSTLMCSSLLFLWCKLRSRQHTVRCESRLTISAQYGTTLPPRIAALFLSSSGFQQQPSAYDRRLIRERMLWVAMYILKYCGRQPTGFGFSSLSDSKDSPQLPVTGMVDERIVLKYPSTQVYETNARRG